MVVLKLQCLRVYPKRWGLMTENGDSWDEEIISDVCNYRDRKLIKQIPIPIRSREDSWF